MYGGALEGLVWSGDGPAHRFDAYSGLANLSVIRSLTTGRIGAEVLSDSQSVLRVMNPRARNGVAVETVLSENRNDARSAPSEVLFSFRAE